MFTWKKLGRIFHPQSIEDRPWLKEFAQAPAVLKFDTFIRVYFSCRPAADENGQYVSYSSFVDLDRSDITKVIAIADQPILELGKRGCFDEFGTYPVSIIRHNDEVRAYYAGWTRCASVPFNVAIGYAVSRDNGVTFQKTGPGPVVSYSIDEPFVISGPKIRRYNDLWYLWYIAGKKWIPNSGRPEPVYRIRMATSVNGIDWVKANKDLVPCRLEENECQASPDVFFHNGRYHMFYCYRYSLNYRGKEGGYRIGYAWSDDLVHWTRDDDKAGIDISGEGWDSEMISYPHVFELDGSIYMFYLGNQVGRHGFGAAKLEGEL
jgi:hypothetical protein